MNVKGNWKILVGALLSCLAVSYIARSTIRHSFWDGGDTRVLSSANFNNISTRRSIEEHFKDGSLPSVNQTNSTTLTITQKMFSPKVIMLHAGMGAGQFGKRGTEFKTCEFSNCVFLFSNNLEDVARADIVAPEYQSKAASTARRVQPSQLFIAHCHESPGYSYHRWNPFLNQFDGTMTYSRNSTIYYPWGVTLPLSDDKRKATQHIDYARGRTKGAYAYVSNCNSQHYDRLKVMKELSKYINVDIYGDCTGKKPCSRQDFECEAKLHSQYRFYLAFENSLCTDYITEKFWKTLFSSAHFVPVTIGGLSIDEYTSIAPPDSFLHAYNFSSIAQLGHHLRHLMDDDAAYNRYHQWRQQFEVAHVEQRVACDLCKLANNPESIKSHQPEQLADIWNDPKNCREQIPFATRLG